MTYLLFRWGTHFLLLISFFDLNLKSNDYSLDKLEKIKREYEKTKAAYWKQKTHLLKERDFLKEKNNLLDEQIKSLYQQKNNILEDTYLLKDQLKEILTKNEEKISQSSSFNSRLSEIIHLEKKKINFKFPYLKQILIKKLNNLSQQMSASPQIEEIINKILLYKNFLLKEGESSHATTGNILTEKNEILKNVRFLRLGFIFNAYTANSHTGYLLRQDSINGVFYEWQSKLPNDLSRSFKSSINQAFKNIQNKKLSNSYLPVLIDTIQAGTKLKDFKQRKTFGLFNQVFHYFLAGGIIMIPLLALSFFSIFLICERIIFFRKRYNIKNELPQFIIDIKNHHVNEAYNKCNQTSSVLSIFKDVFTHPLQNRLQIEEILENHLSNEYTFLNKRLSTIAILAAIAPLMGLLGTVAGMITLFDVITLYGTANPKILAGGISVALITTQTGLAIAIPIMLTHHFLVKKKNQYQKMLESITREILIQLFPKNKKHKITNNN